MVRRVPSFFFLTLQSLQFRKGKYLNPKPGPGFGPRASRAPSPGRRGMSHPASRFLWSSVQQMAGPHPRRLGGRWGGGRGAAALQGLCLHHPGSSQLQNCMNRKTRGRPHTCLSVSRLPTASLLASLGPLLVPPQPYPALMFVLTRTGLGTQYDYTALGPWNWPALTITNDLIIN